MLQSSQASQGKLHAHTEEFLYSKIRKHSAHGLMGVTQSTNERLRIKWSNPQVFNLSPRHTHPYTNMVCFFFLFFFAFQGDSQLENTLKVCSAVN